MSNSASTIGLPVLRVSSSASSSARCAHDLGELEEDASAVLRRRVLPGALVERRRARRRRRGPRPPRLASGTRAITSVVDGSITSSHDEPRRGNPFAVDVEGVRGHRGNLRLYSVAESVVKLTRHDVQEEVRGDATRFARFAGFAGFTGCYGSRSARRSRRRRRCSRCSCPRWPSAPRIPIPPSP